MERLVGAWQWAVLYVTGSRCFVCGRRYRWHTPWDIWRCNRTPLPIEITEQGWARLEGEGEQVA
jgi:hypothetical protein